jgi:hypothetical protein
VLYPYGKVINNVAAALYILEFVYFILFNTSHLTALHITVVTECNIKLFLH